MDSIKAPLAVAKVLLAQGGLNSQLSYLVAKLATRIDPDSEQAELWAEINTLFERQKSINSAFDDMLTVLEGMHDA